MQTTSEALQKVILPLALLFCAISACKKSDGFEEALAKSKNSLVDQVNSISTDTPYYSMKVLNPVDAPNEATPVVEIPKFNLMDQNGNIRDESLFKGKITVVGFIFTSCKGFCPFVLEGMKKIARKGDKNLQFVAFTVDPEHDTSKELLEYANKRGLDPKQWVLLTGDKDTLLSIAKVTFASQTFQKASAERDFIHSEHLYIIDEDGKLRGIINGTRTDVGADGEALIGRLISQSKRYSVE